MQSMWTTMFTTTACMEQKSWTKLISTHCFSSLEGDRFSLSERLLIPFFIVNVLHPFIRLHFCLLCPSHILEAGGKVIQLCSNQDKAKFQSRFNQIRIPHYKGSSAGRSLFYSPMNEIFCDHLRHAGINHCLIISLSH